MPCLIVTTVAGFDQLLDLDWLLGLETLYIFAGFEQWSLNGLKKNRHVKNETFVTSGLVIARCRVETATSALNQKPKNLPPSCSGPVSQVTSNREETNQYVSSAGYQNVCQNSSRILHPSHYLPVYSKTGDIRKVDMERARDTKHADVRFQPRGKVKTSASGAKSEPRVEFS